MSTSGAKATVKISCQECNGKARIGSRDELSLKFSKLYCQCLDVNCGHTFVMNLTFSHSLRPGGGAIDQLLFDRLRKLPKADRRQLMDQLDFLPD
jgi:hypothetical protein